VILAVFHGKKVMTKVQFLPEVATFTLYRFREKGRRSTNLYGLYRLENVVKNG
jgi:hypothetical protein